MTRRRIALVVLLAGCTSFDLVSLPAAVPSAFRGEVVAVLDASAAYTLGALLDRGTDEAGNLTEFHDARLVVNQDTVLPEPSRQVASRYLSYAWRGGGDTTSPPLGGLHIVPPVPRSGRSGTRLEIPLPRRSDPHRVWLPASADTVLRLIVDRPGANVRIAAAVWEAQLRRRCDAAGEPGITVAAGRDAYPDAIPLSAAARAAVPGERVEVCFVGIFEYESVDSPYPAGVTVRPRIRWIVERPAADRPFAGSAE